MSTTIDLTFDSADEYPLQECNGETVRIPVRAQSIRQLASNLEIGVSSSKPLAESETIESNDSNPLPNRDPLLEGLAKLQCHLDNRSLVLVADNHLNGKAAPVLSSDQELYAVVGEDLFDSIREEWEYEVSDDVWSALQVLYTLEVSLASNELDDHPSTGASWPAVTGRQVDQTSGLIAAVDFPLASVNDHPMVEGRGLALGAGAQRLANDVGAELETIGPYYMFHHLAAVTDSTVKGTEVLSTVADIFSMDVVAVDRACVEATENVANAAAEGEIPVDDTAMSRYYLPERVAEKVTEAFGGGAYNPKY